MTGSIDDRLAILGLGVKEQHPRAIDCDAFAFDISITNTSAPDDPVLTTFAFQSNPLTTNLVASV